MSEKLYYSMGEVAEMFDVNQSLLRHWESQFPILRPKRNKKGNRLFTPQDVEHLKQIYHLVKECGMTLEGAKRAMRGQRSGKGVSRDVELMERLQRIRALLVEVREELKGDGESVLADADAVDTAADSGFPAGTRVPADGGAAGAVLPAGPAPGGCRRTGGRNGFRAGCRTPFRAGDRTGFRGAGRAGFPQTRAQGRRADRRGDGTAFGGGAVGCSGATPPRLAQTPPQEGGGRAQGVVRLLRTVALLTAHRKPRPETI